MSVSRSSAEHGSARLAARRRSRRRRASIALAVLFVLVCAGIVYGLNQGATRISHITVYGADQSLAAYATTAMQGKYLGLIPRDSTFFFPASRIRAAIMSAHPEIAAVALFRDGFSGLSIRVDERVPIARWCGAPPDSSSAPATSTPAVADCYLFDASGFVYATSTSDVRPVNSFILYEGSATSSEPVGETLPDAAKLPAAFDFARQLAPFGSPATSVVITNDEVRDYLASGTYLTYVLGDEQHAYAALSSAQADFNLADGSVDYLDLRFDGKVYLKKKK
ncbi:MAG TPA: hypothetical protein PLW99_03575 [Candidatus Paceibacterota bacterium]|nr:hypothetical protein [Candidatus Paceibacterota bacterium]